MRTFYGSNHVKRQGTFFARALDCLSPLTTDIMIHNETTEDTGILTMLARMSGDLPWPSA